MLHQTSMHELMIHLLRCLAERGFPFCSSAPSDEHAGQQRLIDLETQVYELGSANLWFRFALFLACTRSTGYPHCSSSLFLLHGLVPSFLFPFFHESSRVKQKKLHPLFVVQSLLTPFELATVAAFSFSKALAS